MQAESSPERKGQINFAELPHPFHPHSAHIHLAPLRRKDLTSQRKLLGGRAAGEQIVHGLPAGGRFRIQPRKLSQRGDGVLPRPTGCATRLDQRPVFVGNACDRTAMPAQIHECILYPANPQRQRAVLRYTPRGA